VTMEDLVVEFPTYYMQYTCNSCLLTCGINVNLCH